MKWDGMGWDGIDSEIDLKGGKAYHPTRECTKGGGTEVE